MSFARDPTDSDDCFVSALQIFECYGVKSTSSLRVDALMDKFAPFVKTNKAELSFLKDLLDPEQCNPEINVDNLAQALHQFTQSQKTKVDLDESFNLLKTGNTPQDSDSGISADGLHLLEELQCELREKEHIAHQLRSQLDFTDRQHEEAVAALSSERDSLHRHLNMLREEVASLSHMRPDYEEACERLCVSTAALEDARRELDTLRRRDHTAREHIAALHADKLSLQELLSKSKEECHRINEMYAARQSALLEENETRRAQCADLTSRLQDHDEVLQQVISEKIQLEMELKDIMNKSNQTHFRLDRSIEVSYTEDQMLTALDTLNSDSRFASEQMSVSTQADVPCCECAHRDAHNRSFRRYFWEPLKCLFQVFAIVCFFGAVIVLYGVSQRASVLRCERTPTPWRWFDAQDVMDLLFRIEYTSEVPM